MEILLILGAIWFVWYLFASSDATSRHNQRRGVRSYEEGTALEQDNADWRRRKGL